VRHLIVRDCPEKTGKGAHRPPFFVVYRWGASGRSLQAGYTGRGQTIARGVHVKGWVTRRLGVSSGMVGALLLVAGCAQEPRLQGYVFSPEHQIAPGMNRDEVVRLMGEPVLVDPLEPRRWVYASARVERKAFVAPRVLDQRTLVVVFDSGDKVARVVEGVPLAVGRESPDPAVTPVLGRSVGVVQQMFRGVHQARQMQKNS
jgi:outer membrane protein assembly factor BamE (lipoprotein component of BamABCDE complex)